MLKAREHNKLCKCPVECAWPRQRIIPQRQHVLYAQMPLWLLARRELTPGEKLVYVRLAFFGGNRGVAWAAASTVADEVGISKRQVGEIGLPPVFDPLAMRVLVGFRGLGWW